MLPIYGGATNPRDICTGASNPTVNSNKDVEKDQSTLLGAVKNKRLKADTVP